MPATPRGVATLSDPAYLGMERMASDSLIFFTPFQDFRRVLEFDSTNQYVIIEESLFDRAYRLPVKMDLNYYLQQQLEIERRRLWTQQLFKDNQVTISSSAGGIELNIPGRIKSKAFKRIFGGDRVGLRVSGNITFEIAGRTESREGSAVTSIEQRNTFSPKFKQTQQFRVEGRVGDKVTISVDQNSEATFDFENTLKLTYEGDEDEIIQSIEAGNVGLSLPSTRFVSTTSNHQGLFGVKTEARVGNLSFTGIASLERGENETLNVSGSSRENTVRKNDYEFVRNKFYFLDSLYLAQFENLSRQMIPNVDGGRRVRQLDVWKSVNATTNRLETVPGFAVLDANAQIDTMRSDENGRFEVARFQRLQEDEYSFDPDRGYFWLKGSTIQDEQVLAIAYSYGDPNNPTEVGTLFQNVDTTQSALILQLIRGQFSDPDYPTWDLEMKNVYDLGAIASPEGFDVEILYTEKGEDQAIDASSGNSYNFILGLDRLNEQGGQIEGGDQKIDVENNPFIFDLSNGYLILPALRPFDPGPPPGPNNPDFQFATDRYVDIYDTEIQNDWLQRTKFQIEITTKSVSNTFELGFNVLEGSEKVRLNGRELKRDTDYTIDYFSGQLQISAPEARRADAQIEIEYERGQLFQLDKKSLLGARLEYSFSPENFVGFTTLYYSKSTLDQRVRLGQEPLQNWVWDVNTALTFKPNFLSTVLDKLPILETSAESKLKIEAEFAQVNPNPNTFNEESLGETDGVAYIDDFEGSKRFTTLGIQYQIWTPASVPARFRVLRDPTINFGTEDFISRRDYTDQLDVGRVGYFWYNPFNQIAIRSIWPNRDTNTQSGNTTNILVLSWQDVNAAADRAWGGMMRSTASFSDQSRTKFVEIWLNGEGAQVNVDVGTISEDYFTLGTGFGTLNTEDKNFNGLLDLGEGADFEDTGVDGVVGVDGANIPGDAGNDDWASPNTGDNNPSREDFRFINGTEGNSERQGARFPDTEDLDGDGTLNETNNYFSYSINLNDGAGGRLSPYFIEETIGDEGPTGWKLFRIPLNDVRRLAVGNPDASFQQVLNTRVWLNDFEGNEGSIGVAAIDFVGNEWEDVGFKKDDDTPFVIDENRFKVTVLNTDENERYVSPPGVEGIVDRVTRVESKEQSLVYQISDFPTGARVEARKQLREKISLLNYRNLRMFVHGEVENDLGMMQGDTLEFYLRFGVTDDIYYEYRQPIFSGWTDSAERNNVDIDFDILASTKEEGDSIGISDAGERIIVRKDPNYPLKEIAIHGNPGLHNIKYFIAGVRNKGSYVSETEVWFDELRLTGVERESGTAMRLVTDLTIADIGRINAQWELVDDDFRRVEDQFSNASGQGQSDEKQSYNMNVNVDKFLPESWGLDIPVSGSLRRSRKVPKYFFNSDRRTNYSLGSFGNRVNAFFGLADTPAGLEQEITKSESKAIGGTIQRRRGQRDPWYLKYTVNQLVIDVDYANTESSSPNVEFNNTEKLSGSVKFGIPFGKNTYFKPLSWLGESSFLKGLSSQKFYYLPSRADADFAINDEVTRSKNRLEIAEREPNIRVRTSRKFVLDYKMLESLNFNYNRNYQNDGRLDSEGNVVQRRAGDVLNNIFSRFDFGEDRRVDQRFGINYNPRLLSWLTTGYRYQSDFIYSFDNPQLQARSATSNVSQSLQLDFKLSTLMNKIYKPKNNRAARPSNNRGRGGRRPASRGEDDEKSEEDGEEADEEASGGSSFPNPAIFIWHFFNSFKSFNVDFKKSDSYGNSNLQRIPRWQYQFGFADDPNPTDTLFSGTPENPLVIQPASIKNTRGVDGSVQLDLARNLKTNFKYNYQKVDNQANDQVTQSISSSIFFLGDDPDAEQQDWWKLIPDWRVSFSGLEKLPLIKNFATSASVEHARNGKFSENSRFEGEVKNRDNTSYSINYQPFIGITINTKWGVTGNIRSNRSTTFDYRAAGSTSKREQSGFSLNASYSVTRGFNLPLPFLKNRKLKNEIQFQMAFDQSSSSNFTRTIAQSNFEELDVTDNWKLRPSITYRFSQRVNGTAFYEQSTASNKRTGDTSYKEFGINVNIAIR